MRVQLHFALDVSSIEDKITEAIEGVSLTGLGADGTSEYEVTDVTVDANDPLSITADVTIERVEGKFVSRDDITEELTSNLEDEIEVGAGGVVVSVGDMGAQVPSALTQLATMIAEVTRYGDHTSEGPAVVDVHFFRCVVHESFDRERFRELLRAALADRPDGTDNGEFNNINEARAAQGPSYIEWGAWIGSQDLALRMFACGEVAGLWKVITPKRLGVEGAMAEQMAGGGYVMSGPPNWDAPL